MSDKINISIIIPAKDEQERLPRFLRTVVDYCLRSSHSCEIIVVDDGSSDNTVQEVRVFQKDVPSLNIISLGKNYGKGYAVKQGFLLAKGEKVLFLDADGSTQVQEIDRHLPLFDQGYDIVIGSRVLNDGKVRVKALAYRRWMGNIFNFLVSSLLIKNIKDTQCGFKMFRSDVVRDIFPQLHLNGFGFDLEVLYLAQKKNYRIKEVSVNWTHVEGSKVRIIKDSWKMFCNIIQIRHWHR